MHHTALTDLKQKLNKRRTVALIVSEANDASLYARSNNCLYFGVSGSFSTATLLDSNTSGRMIACAAVFLAQCSLQSLCLQVSPHPVGRA